MTETKNRGPMPPEILARWQAALAAVDRDEIEAHFQRQQVAAQEQSLSGFVRRCIRDSDKSLFEIVRETQIDEAKMIDFLAGEGPLASTELDRILAALHVEPVAGNTP